MLVGKQITPFILNQPVELSEGLIPAVVGNQNLIPYRRAYGKTLIPFGPFEIAYKFPSEVKSFFNIKLYNDENMMFVQYGSAIKLYYNKLPSDITQDGTLTLATPDEITYIHSVDTPTQTIITLSDKRSFSVEKQANGQYTVKLNTLKGYDNVIEIVSLNHTYIMHRGDNTFAFSDSINDQTQIPSGNIISALPPKEKIQKIIVVGNILYIFGTNIMVCYQGVSSFNNQLPFTYISNAYRKYKIANSECATEQNGSLYTIGSVTEGVYTLHLQTVYSTKIVFTSAINNFLNISPDIQYWNLESFVLYDHENIMAYLGYNSLCVLYNPATDYSALIQPTYQNLFIPYRLYRKQFVILNEKYFFDPRGSSICNTAIAESGVSKEGSEYSGVNMFTLSIQVLRGKEYTLELAMTLENAKWQAKHTVYLVNREKVLIRNADGIQTINYAFSSENLQIPIKGDKISATIHRISFIKLKPDDSPVEIVRSTATKEQLENTMIIMYSQL